MVRAVATIVCSAGFAVAALTTAAWAGQPTPVETHPLFQPIPIGWHQIAFKNKASAPSPWAAKLLEKKTAWLGNYLVTLSANDFPPANARPDALPRAANQHAIGEYLVRFDAGRNYNDLASTVTDFAQSPDAPDFRPLYRSKHKRSAYSVPYLGFSFTAPTTAPAR